VRLLIPQEKFMRHPFKSTLFICAMLMFTFFASAAEQKATGKEEGLLPLEDLRTFTRIYDHIRSGYVDEVTDATLLEYAIKGMLAELDPHSAYLDKTAFEDLQAHTTGEFGGVGIEIGTDNGFIKVISPIDGTPAQKAGIETGDIIIKLNDKSVKGMSLNDAVQIMRGPKGSTLIMGIMRSGTEKPFDVTIVRDTIRVQSVRTRMLEAELLYIRVAQFQIDSGRDMEKKIRDQIAKTPNIKGVILDLRNNPGGVLQASVDVADAFLESGLVVYTEGRLENSDINYNAGPGDVTAGLPLVVLINEGSASASEIVAGALQDHKRAVIMGTRSFGKGSVQTVIPISEDRAIKLTTALYFTPSGRSIQAQGIEPDVLVERAEVKAIKAGLRPTEADLSRHLPNRTGEESNAKTRELAPVDELLAKDHQLQEAVNLLKGLHIFRQHTANTALLDNAENAHPNAATDDVTNP
jgi:carboxyl-terminal processing protease